MTKNRLMKIMPNNPQFNCRGNGRRRVRRTEVKKTRAVWPVGRLPSKKITHDMLNPSPELMIPITQEDIKTIGLQVFRKPDIDYSLNKYHEDLVHSGQEVTVLLLRNKAVELFKAAGVAINTFTYSPVGIALFLRRTWRLRNAKSNGKVTKEDFMKCSIPNSDYYVTQPQKRKKASQSKQSNCSPVAQKRPKLSKSAAPTICESNKNVVDLTNERVPSLFNLFSSLPPENDSTCVPDSFQPPNGLINISSPAHSQCSTQSSSSLLDLFSNPVDHNLEKEDTPLQSRLNGLSDSNPVDHNLEKDDTPLQSRLNGLSDSYPVDHNLEKDDTPCQSRLNGLSHSISIPAFCTKSSFNSSNESQEHISHDMPPAKRKPQTDLSRYFPGYSFPELLSSRKKNLNNDKHEQLINYVDSDFSDDSSESDNLYSALYDSFATSA